MSDELQLPEIPEPKPEDPEDVSWALSTAEAMWARGDHSEGIKWVRRAAEAAADAENDERSLELAKAAAELAGMLTRRQSRASIHIEDDELVADPPPPPPPKAPTQKPAPPKPAPRGPSSVTKQVSTPSRPPAPLPSKTSQPPPAMGKAVGKPLGTNTPKSIPPPKMAAKTEKSDKRRSKTSLENEARAAFAADTSPDPVDGGADTSESPVVEAPVGRRSRPELGSNDPTFVGSVADVLKRKAESAADDGAWEGEDRSAAEWDASPTQNLTGDELGFPVPPADPRKTSVQLGAPDFKSTVMTMPKPGAKTTAATPATPRAVEPHDPGITTTQAVRVVVWRDGSGVHVAPAGTVVSAITVDAVLVALDANADLTAWLTQKGR